jgi:3',5'-cyclic AMP phosphodiesterase CpdA
MESDWKRRDFLRLMGIGGVVFTSGAVGCAAPAAGSGAAPRPGTTHGASPPRPPRDDFFFLQLSDTHWGFKGPPNPYADVTLERAIATINEVDVQPDFIVFTGDLTHTTDDAAERRDRMSRFRDIVSVLKVKDVRFLPGEHDASPDRGDAFRQAFGEMHYSFDHKDVHFVALDNVSAGGAGLGNDQLGWLAGDLARLSANTPVVLFAHRPLFDLYPDWDWMTRDGAQAIELLNRRGKAFVRHRPVYHSSAHRSVSRPAHPSDGGRRVLARTESSSSFN